MIICYTTCKDKDEAKRIANHLLGMKLIACANMFEIRSLYHWKGELRDEAEVFLLMKTQAKHWPALQREIKKLHSYELPAIVRLDAKGSAQFEKWIAAETNSLKPQRRKHSGRN